MKSRILHTSYVIDFLDVEFDSDKLSEILEVEADKVLDKITSKDLSDWEVQFKGVYGKGEQIKVFTGNRSYTSDKIKLIVIHIPIPTKQISSWGVEDKQHISIGTPPSGDKYFKLLPVNYGDFTNRFDYILNSFRRGIELSFKEGFKVNGQLIALKPQVKS
ncbi:hypothetical protein HUW51_19070 [Adhaeribacter swui]|uniref:Uncharacterized protein n=1 Tax=Adhaeribacter swui TaxID=2086471 RepID=A0A7G7GC44_9BACT|nr:Imm9 family immunity protein [Adhaeribacter swui]QNF34728.1 hypothetical protein HUW51_19070 [Adhaeribacter swui]